MIKVTGSPFAHIANYLGAVADNADRVYLESAKEAGDKLAEELNAQAKIAGAPAVFSTYHDPNHGVITGPSPHATDKHEEIFNKEFGTLKESPVGFVRGTLSREKGKNFSDILTEKLGRIRPNVSSG